jgi:hypothetical protein
MKKISALAFVALLGIATSCIKKKPTACMEVSNTSPEVDESIALSADCSQHGKWYDYEIDGNVVSSDADGRFVTSFKKPGHHTVKLTVYNKWEGNYSSRTGCDCRGAGKSHSTITDIDVHK